MYQNQDRLKFNQEMESIIKTSSQRLPAEDSEEENVNLVDCQNCGRHFTAERIQTHEVICQKQKKRKPFDVCQQRIKGTDAEKFYKKNRTKLEKVTPPVNNWRKQHEEFLMNMKAARELSAFLKKGGNIRDLPPPPRSDYSDYIQCPTCQRKFNATAAERHIPKCAELQLIRPKPLPPRKTSLKKPAESSSKSKK